MITPTTRPAPYGLESSGAGRPNIQRADKNLLYRPIWKTYKKFTKKHGLETGIDTSPLDTLERGVELEDTTSCCGTTSGRFVPTPSIQQWSGLCLPRSGPRHRRTMGALLKKGANVKVTKLEYIGLVNADGSINDLPPRRKRARSFESRGLGAPCLPRYSSVSTAAKSTLHVSTINRLRSVKIPRSTSTARKASRVGGVGKRRPRFQSAARPQNRTAIQYDRE